MSETDAREPQRAAQPEVHVVHVGAELRRVGAEVTGTHLAAGIAVLHDWHSWWAIDQDGRPSTHVDHPDVLRAWHRALWEAHLAAGIAHPEHDLIA